MNNTTLCDVLSYIKDVAQIPDLSLISKVHLERQVVLGIARKKNFQLRNARRFIRDKMNKEILIKDIGFEIYSNLLREGFFYEQNEIVRITE